MISKISWSSWKWPRARPFLNPNTKNVYLALSKHVGWEKSANTSWKVDWIVEEWEQILGRLWASQGTDHMKVFVWKALMGALPTCEKATIGSMVCKGCNADIETMHLLHWQSYL